MLRGALWGSAFVSVLLLASEAQAQCTKDTDCKGERVCEAGVCQVPMVAALPAAPSGAVPAPATPPVAAPPPAAHSTQASVDLRSEEPPPKPKMERNSVGMMAGGIVMVSLAPIALAAGMLYSLQGVVCRGSDRALDGRVDDDCDHYSTTAAAYTLTSLALIGVGVPLIVIGAKRVPAKEPWQAAILPYATPDGVGIGMRLRM